MENEINNNQITAKSVEDEAFIRFYSKLISPGELIFDVGANIGNHSARFASMGNPVIAVEPQPDCQLHLLARFFTQPLVRIAPLAVGPSCGIAEMQICDAANTISTLSKEWTEGRFSEFEWNRTIKVTTVTMEQLIEIYGTPKYCKIDVEGFELEVLKGLRQAIPIVSLEYTREGLIRAIDCIERLLLLGFKRFNITRAEQYEFLLSESSGPEKIMQFIDSDEDPLLWGDIYAFSE